MSAIGEQAALLQQEWQTGPRWAGITRDYSARDVIGLRGCVAGEEHGPARRAASWLWGLLHSQDVGAGARRGHGSQAVQEVKAGWRGSTWPDRGRRLRWPDGAPEAFGLMKTMIAVGAAGVRFDDQLPAGGERARPASGSLSRPLSTSGR